MCVAAPPFPTTTKGARMPPAAVSDDDVRYRAAWRFIERLLTGDNFPPRSGIGIFKDTAGDLPDGGILLARTAEDTSLFKYFAAVVMSTVTSSNSGADVAINVWNRYLEKIKRAIPTPPDTASNALLNQVAWWNDMSKDFSDVDVFTAPNLVVDAEGTVAPTPPGGGTVEVVPPAAGGGNAETSPVAEGKREDTDNAVPDQTRLVERRLALRAEGQKVVAHSRMIRAVLTRLEIGTQLRIAVVGAWKPVKDRLSAFESIDQKDGYALRTGLVLLLKTARTARREVSKLLAGGNNVDNPGIENARAAFRNVK